MNDFSSSEEEHEELTAHTVRVQQLFIQHQTALRAFLLALQPNFGEADDVLQEIFLTVTSKSAEFREGSNFTAWVFAIARFKLLEMRRAAGKLPMALSDEVIEVLATAPPEPSFFEARLSAMRHCLDRLAPRAQEIVRLRYHKEQGPEEIAAQLEWSANAVNVALTRARNGMRQCVEKNSREIK